MLRCGRRSPGPRSAARGWSPPPPPLVGTLDAGVTDATTAATIARLVAGAERLANGLRSTETTPMPSIPPDPEREAAIRARLSAAILDLALAQETVGDARARAALEAAWREVWAAADLLNDPPPPGAAR
jgi:hypothetical protein